MCMFFCLHFGCARMTLCNKWRNEGRIFTSCDTASLWLLFMVWNRQLLKDIFIQKVWHGITNMVPVPEWCWSSAIFQQWAQWQVSILTLTRKALPFRLLTAAERTPSVPYFCYTDVFVDVYTFIYKTQRKSGREKTCTENSSYVNYNGIMLNFTLKRCIFPYKNVYVCTGWTANRVYMWATVV